MIARMTPDQSRARRNGFGVVPSTPNIQARGCWAPRRIGPRQNPESNARAGLTTKQARHARRAQRVARRITRARAR